MTPRSHSVGLWHPFNSCPTSGPTEVGPVLFCDGTSRYGVPENHSDDWITIFCSHNKVDCSEIPIVLSNLLYHYFFIELWHILILWLAKMPMLHSILLHFASELKWSRKMRLLSVFYFSFEISIACWLLSRPNWRIVSKLTTDVVTYCTEASNQKSKYAYRKILFYKKSTVQNKRSE